jgi:hypothetical protein
MGLSVGDTTAATDTLTSDWIAETRRHLGSRPLLNQLAGTVSDTDTTLTFTKPLGRIQEGSYLSVGLEVVYVWSVDSTSATATVQRGQNGSTPVAHAANDLVLVNPIVSDYEIVKALNADLTSLCSPASGLYQVRTLDLTAVSGEYGYDFPAIGFLSVADVRWQQLSPVTKNWLELTDWAYNTDLPTSAFPSGSALFIEPRVTPGQTIRVRYRSQFTGVSALTDDVTVTGIPVSALDLPPLGAAITVMGSRPIVRADTSSQGDTRRATEVATADTTNAAAALRALRAQRIGEERERLSQQWPYRVRDMVKL